SRCTHVYCLFFFSRLPSPPSSSLFPYTTLFRSQSIDGQNRIIRILYKPDEFVSEIIECGDPAASEIANKDAIAEPAEIARCPNQDRKSTRLNSSHVAISYAVFCLKKKKNINITQ